MSDSGLMSERAPDPVGAYPHARRVGNLLFLSGVGPRRPGSNDIPASFDEQCRSCFANVRAILEDAGSSWERIVDVLVFLTDMDGQFAAYNRIYAEHFAGPGKPNPTRTTIEVARLPTAISVELKVVATVG